MFGYHQDIRGIPWNYRKILIFWGILNESSIDKRNVWKYNVYDYRCNIAQGASCAKLRNYLKKFKEVI